MPIKVSQIFVLANQKGIHLRQISSLVIGWSHFKVYGGNRANKINFEKTGENHKKYKFNEKFVF